MAVIPFQNSVYGFPGTITTQNPKPIISNRAPTIKDVGQIGQLWIQPTLGIIYILSSIISNVSAWTNLSGGSGDFTSLTVQPGNLLVTGGGSLSVTGGGNILTSGNITGDDIVAQTSLTVIFGGIIANNGSISSQSLSNDNIGSSYTFYKSHNANGAVQVGDTLGSIVFAGWQTPTIGSSEYINTAAIASNVSAIGSTPNNYPSSNLNFFTGQSGTLTSRLVIGNGGGITIQAPDSGATPGLVVIGSAAAQTLYSGSDLGGISTFTGLSNVTVSASGISAGMVVQTSSGAGTTASAGFIKMYVGTTAVYIPYWTQTT